MGHADEKRSSSMPPGDGTDLIFPKEFPYDYASAESNNEEYMTCLTRKIANTFVLPDDDDDRSCSSVTKGCVAYKPPPYGDSVYPCAGEVGFLTRRPPPLPVLPNVSDMGYYCYDARQKLRLIHVKQQQLLRQQQQADWAYLKRRNRVPFPSWPLLQQQRQLPGSLSAVGSGMRVVFLGGGGKACAGTGVFLPRRPDDPPESRKKLACSTILVPANVVQALSLLNLGDVGLRHPCNSTTALSNPKGGVNAPKGSSYAAVDTMHKEISLPEQWTY